MGWKKYREDFLWFSYFGVTEDDVKSLNDAILACSRRAYADLSRTLDYKYSVSDLKKDENIEIRKSFERWKTCFRCTVDGKIIAHINKLFGMKTVDENVFNSWHKKVCKDIIESAAEGSKPKDIKEQHLFGKKGEPTNSITYGQAQKWVNMTLKNLLVMGKINHEDDKHKRIQE